MLILAGIVIGIVSVAVTLESLPVGGPFTSLGLLFGWVVAVAGVTALFAAVLPGRRVRRRLSTLLGIVGIGFSLFSIVGSLGGLFVGLVFGVAGGTLCIDWTFLREHRVSAVLG